MTKLEALLVQLINQALSGNMKALREVIHLREKVQELEPNLTPAPELIVNFIVPYGMQFIQKACGCSDSMRQCAEYTSLAMGTQRASCCSQ
jgi:hypothetical protein